MWQRCAKIRSLRRDNTSISLTGDWNKGVNRTMIGPQQDIGSFEFFKQQLQDVLGHLYDPAFSPGETIWVVTGVTPSQGVEAVQSALIRAIEALRPAPDVPATARARRIYGLLSCRYIRQLTQSEVAEHLGFTPRHVRREQREAVDVLAHRLWAGYPKVFDNGEATAARDTARPEPSPSSAWRSQVKQELASLQKTDPNSVANVEEAVKGVIALERTLAERRGIRLQAGHIQQSTYAAIHPSALRQILVAAVGRLVQYMSSGEIALGAQTSSDSIKITITGCPVEADQSLNSALVREIVSSQGGDFGVDSKDACTVFHIELPSVKEITVLVIDDNSDLVHFYQRYVAGTKYHIVQVAEGKGVLKAVRESEPDVIVLDVMLPDMDGWELLTLLSEYPETRAIPVIVCSVVREEELALALGAALYLAKPVRRRQFLRALDQVLDSVSERALRSRANSAISC
jgi:CheY-like chemotaxis protein